MKKAPSSAGSSAAFWDREYQDPEHLALSNEPSSDLQKFVRWVERSVDPVESGFTLRGAQVLDLGCGNGRNLIYLAREYGCRGIGYDVSEEAVRQAQKAAAGAALTFTRRSIAGPLDLPDQSVDLVLDMMTSHFLRASEREQLREEIARVLKPGGFLFFKTFLADGDKHVERLLAEHPADEKGAYIHPRIGVYEYAWREQDIYDFFDSANFEILKIEPSHKHIMDGKAYKRRTVSVYVQRRW